MYEIKIYGDISPIQGEGLVSLIDVQKQLSKAEGKPLRVRINSFGGDVDTGFAIYSELRRYAEKYGVKIETFGEAYVASIATVIFLAGESRILTAHTQPFVHNAWTFAEGDSRTLSEVSEGLEGASDKIAKHYESHTKLSYDEARQLMDENTSITVEDAISLGFATAKEDLKPPLALMNALRRTKIINNRQMNKKQSLFAKLTSLVKSYNAKDVTTADERTLVFEDVEIDDEIKEGDKATIDGEPADGEIVMKTGETYVFEAGELKEIRAKEEEVKVTEEEFNALKAENQELITNLETAVNLIETYQTANAKLKEVVSGQPNRRQRDANDGKLDGNGGKKSAAATALARFKELEKKTNNK